MHVYEIKKQIIHIHTWPTRVLIRVLRSLLSLRSVIRICCFIISADVKGRLGLPLCGTVNPNLGLDPEEDRDRVGDKGLDPMELLRLERLSILSPNSPFTRLVTGLAAAADGGSEAEASPAPPPEEL